MSYFQEASKAYGQGSVDETLGQRWGPDSVRNYSPYHLSFQTCYLNEMICKAEPMPKSDYEDKSATK